MDDYSLIMEKWEIDGMKAQLKQDEKQLTELLESSRSHERKKDRAEKRTQFIQKHGELIEFLVAIPFGVLMLFWSANQVLQIHGAPTTIRDLVADALIMMIGTFLSVAIMIFLIKTFLADIAFDAEKKKEVALKKINLLSAKITDLSVEVLVKRNQVKNKEEKLEAHQNDIN